MLTACGSGEIKTQTEYNKEVDADAAFEMDHLYTVDLQRVPNITLDASNARNVAALINDYRGRDPPATPNVRFVECYVDNRPAIVIDNMQAIPANGQARRLI